MLRALAVCAVAATAQLAWAEISHDAKFEYTGTSSDLAQQFFKLHSDGKKAPALDITSSDLPSDIKERLPNGTTFESLPGLLQRALLWDSGYVRDGQTNKLVKVYSQCNDSMAQIAVLETQYLWAGCTTDEKCKYQRNGVCNMPMIAKAAHCATDAVSSPTQTSMWAIGGNANSLPEPNLLFHNWEEQDGNFTNKINAIHTVAHEVQYGQCPSEDKLGIIIPCLVYNETAHRTKYCTPKYNDLVTAWLLDPNGGVNPSAAGFKTIYLVPIIVGALLVIGAGVFFLRRRRTNQELPKTTDNGPYAETQRDGNCDYMNHADLRIETNGTISKSASQTSQSTYSRETDSAAVKTLALLERRLVDDPLLARRRLPYDELEFTRALSKGAFGEVWLCHWKGTPLAVKKLLGHKSETVNEIAGFIAEIQLTASLDHPHIIKLVGVAWSNMENLCMAMEFLPNGDVLSYLKANNDMLSWVRDKLPMALGVAHALEYLHSRPTPIIHRDVKAKNVLLTDTLEVKLIDFGVSRDKAMETMTAGVGTPYWSAPEVLDGSRYTEKSDIYSFGVLLSELDCGSVPYQNLRSQATGERLKALQILNMIVTGKLRPEFRPDCPGRISGLAVRCLHMDPASRPTATEIVDILSGKQHAQQDYLRL